MSWQYAGLTDQELTNMIRAEEFAMAHSIQSQAERARSVQRVNEISRERTRVRAAERRRKRWERFLQWEAEKNARRAAAGQGPYPGCAPNITPQQTGE